MFYDLFNELCKQKGVSVTKATVDIGLSRTIGTKWKTTGATPQGETLSRIAEYFNVTTDRLLGNEQKEAPTGEGGRGLEQAKIALFGGGGEVTDEMWEEAVFAAQLIKDRHKRENDKK